MLTLVSTRAALVVMLALLGITALGIAALGVMSAERPRIVVESEDGWKSFGEHFLAHGSTLVAFDAERTVRGRWHTILRIFETGEEAREVYRENNHDTSDVYALHSNVLVRRVRSEGGESLRFLMRGPRGWENGAETGIERDCQGGYWEGQLSLGERFLAVSSHDVACIYQRVWMTWHYTHRFDLKDDVVRVAVSGERIVIARRAYIEVHERTDGVWHRRLIALPTRSTLRSIAVSERWLVVQTDRADTLHVYDITDGQIVTTLPAPPSPDLPLIVIVSDTTLVASGSRIDTWKYDGEWHLYGPLQPDPPTATRYPRRAALADSIWIGEPVNGQTSPRGGTIQGYR